MASSGPQGDPLLSIVEDPPGTFRLSGELDISNADQLADLVLPAADRAGDLVLDVGELRFVDSSGIRVFIRAMERVRGHGRVVLRRPGGAVRQILTMIGLSPREEFAIDDGEPTPEVTG